MFTPIYIAMNGYFSDIACVVYSLSLPLYTDVEMSMSGRREDERRILQELVEVVEQRDALVGLLEEDRQRWALTGVW